MGGAPASARGDAIRPPATPEDAISIAMDKRVDAAIALALIALGSVACHEATGFRIGAFPDPVTPRGLPYFAGGFLIFAGIVLLIRRLLTWSAFPGNMALSEGIDDDPGIPASALRAFAVVALSVAWLGLIPHLGYLLLTPPIMVAMLWVMDVRSPSKLVLFPIGFTLTIWIVFALVLKVTIPLGPLTALARNWGLMP